MANHIEQTRKTASEIDKTYKPNKKQSSQVSNGDLESKNGKWTDVPFYVCFGTSFLEESLFYANYYLLKYHTISDLSWSTFWVNVLPLLFIIYNVKRIIHTYL